MAKRKTPQEKKRLSLEKDRPAIHGKSNKGGRIGRPRIKKQLNEAFRRKAKAVLKEKANSADEEIEDELKSIKREKWWSSKPKSLGEVIKDKKERRKRDYGARQKRREREIEKNTVLLRLIAEVKKEAKYIKATEERIYNIAFNRYLELIKTNRNAHGKPNREAE